MLLRLGHDGYNKEREANELVVEGMRERGGAENRRASSGGGRRREAESDELRVVRERTWWEGERYVVEGERRK